MPVISNIESQKKRAGYYNIFVDDAFFCSLSELQLAARALRVGQQLEQAELESIKQDSQLQKTYNRAIYYLRYGPRTTAQMRTYLVQKEYEPEFVELAIERLTKERYLSDELYVDSFIEQRQLLKHRSKRQLQGELLKKGIDKTLIESKLSEINDEDQLSSIRQLATKKMRQSKYQDKEKMTHYLLRQGFKYSDIRVVLDEVLEQD